MTIPHTFATYPAGNFPASDWDGNWAFVAALTNIFCTATGTNTIALTPASSSPAITAYQSGMQFSFLSAGANTGATTIAVASLAALSAFDISGNALIAGQILANTYYTAVYDSTLSSGAGGFRVTLANTTITSVGSLPVDAQTGTSYTIPSADNRHLLTGTNSNPQAYTLPQAGGAFPSGWWVLVASYGTGTITVTPVTSTINGAASFAVASLQTVMITSDGTNYQAFPQGLITNSSGDVFSTKGLAVFAAEQGFQTNQNATSPASNYFAPVTMVNNYPVNHTGASVATASVTNLAPGSNVAGGSADVGLLVGAQQLNYLTTAVAGEHDGAIINVYQGVNSTGNGLQIGLTKRANGSNIAAVQSQAIEFSTELVNGSGDGPGTIAIMHSHIGEVFPGNTKYGFGGNMEAQVGVWDCAYLVDTFDLSAGTAGVAPSWVDAFRVRTGRNDANISVRLTAAGALTLGLSGSTVGSVAFNNATSGSITLQPPTGALGSSVLTLPAATDTLIGKSNGLGLAKVAPWQGGYVTGRFYTMPSGGGVTTVALAANTVYYCWITIGENHTFDRIAIEVTATGTAANARLAIYNVAGGIPTSLVVDGGTVGVGTTGLKTVTISQALTPGTYALAAVFDGTVTIDGVAAGNVGIWQFAGVTDFTTPDSQANGALTFGAFPGTAGALSYANANTPIIGLRA